MKKLIVGITAEPSVELLHGQLNYFNKNGYDVSLLAPKHERVAVFCKKEKVNHIPVKIERNISPVKDLKTLFSLIVIFRRHKPDIVNLGTPKISLLGMIAAYLTGVKVRIYTCRGFRFEHESGFLRLLLIFLEKVTSRCAHKVFCISKSVSDLGVDEGIFSRKKVVLLAKGSSNGLDLSLFSPDKVTRDTIGEIKGEFDMNDKFVFVYVGRIVDRKGIKELYEAFDNVYKREPKVRLLMVGRPFWDQIRDISLIDKYNEHPGIVMVGVQPFGKIPEFLSCGDVFILPAWWEGFGNVLIQAAAMGLPILSTNVTGCKDAVNNGYNGKLIESENVDALSEGMEWFMNNDQARKQMGYNGLVWSKNFAPEIIWKGLDELYRNAYHVK